ncbi:Cell division protein FtsZ [Azospirillaceae bacterium]
MINVSLPKIETELKPRITVFGVGGAGGNAVNNMIRSNLEGVDFVVGNTDAQALNGSLAQKRLQLGTTITRGLGAGSRPDIGRAAAEEQIDEIITFLDGANMVFITAGMGGGTGTGAAPVIARAARERGILTVGVVTKPFHFEGAHRMRLAESGIADLQQYVDTLIVIPNQNLFRIANEKTTFADAFKMADDVLHSGVRGVTDLMVMPGLINLDFADIRSVMTEMGKAMMGTGEATGDRRAIEAAEAAISNPLLDDVSMKGARGVLINITGGYDMTLFEVDEAANRIRDEVDPEANIIFGSTFDSSLDGTMRVSVVATGIDACSATRPSASNAVGVASNAAFSLTGGDRGKPRVDSSAPTAQMRADYHAAMVAAPMPPSPTASVAMGAQAVVSARIPDSEQSTAVAAMPSLSSESRPAANVQSESYEALNKNANAAARAAVGPLRGERVNGAFIAPKPADAGARAAALAAQSERSSAGRPSVVSSTDDEDSDDRPRKRPSFFERVGLGVNKPRRENEGPAETRSVASIPSGAPGRSPSSSSRQPIDSADRQKLSPAEEEVLDIPAFLRRQAN